MLERLSLRQLYGRDADKFADHGCYNPLLVSVRPLSVLYRSVRPLSVTPQECPSPECHTTGVSVT